MRKTTQYAVVALFVVPLLFAPQAARAQCDPLSVSVTVTGGPAPNPCPADGTTACVTNLQATATAPTPPPDCTLNNPTYTWSTGAIQYSSDGTNWGPSPGGINATLNGNGATATLTCTFTVCGYWRVPVSCLVHYDDDCGDCWEGTGSTTVSMTSWKLSITVTIAGANAAGQGLPGQVVTGTATICPAGLAATYQWSIPAKTFKSYAANNATATLQLLQPADLQQQTLSWCWADSGNKTVTCTATVNGRSMSASKTVTILDPNPLVNYTSTIGSTQFLNGIAADGASVGVYGADPARPRTLPGIIFNNTFGALAGLGFAEGQWEFTQMVTPARSLLLVGGGQSNFSMNGNLVLDTTYPYAGPYATNTTNSTNDSPSNGLLSRFFTQFTANNESFKMYVMYVPPGAGAQWCPLKYIPWSWSATATWNAPNWALTANGAQTNAAVTTTDHPVWTQNVSGGQFQNINPQPAFHFQAGKAAGRADEARRAPEAGRRFDRKGTGARPARAAAMAGR